MLPLRVSVLAILATFAAMPWLAAGATKTKTDPVTIDVRPQAGRLQLVTGTLREGGVPVVLVRSDMPGEPWWVQGEPTPTGRSGFAAKAVFGSAKTPAGAKFRVVVMLAGPDDGPYRTGQQLKELPDLPLSNQLVVTLTTTGKPAVAVTLPDAPKGLVDIDDKDDKDEPRVAELLSPENADNVERVTVVKGRIDKGYFPVILARPLVKGSVWWVQKNVAADKKGEFDLKVVFGSDRTPQGTRFRLVVLAIATKEKLAEFKPGVAVKELPKTIPASREVVVTLRRPVKTAAPTPAPAATAKPE